MKPGDYVTWVGYKYRILAMSLNFACIGFDFKDNSGTPFFVKEYVPIKNLILWDGLNVIRH